MKNLVTSAAVAAAILICSAAQAGEPMAKLGFGGMKKVSKAKAMKVRGKGANGYTISPYVIHSSSEYVSQHSAAKGLSVEFATLNSKSASHTSALGLKIDAFKSADSFHASKSEYTFIGPTLPKRSYGGYYKH